MSASTASSAGRLAWMSLSRARRICAPLAGRTPDRPSRRRTIVGPMSVAGFRQAAQRRRGSATPRWPRSTAARIGGAAVAMVVVAEVAVWLLGPSDEPPEPGPGRRERLLQAGRARARRRLPQRPAVAAGRRARGRGRGAGLRSRSGARRRCAARSTGSAGRPVLGAAAAGGGRLAADHDRHPAGEPRSRTSARSTSGSRPSRWARGFGTSPAAPGSRPCSRPAARRC